MIPPCRIDTPVNGRAYCHDCRMTHVGHTIELSQEATERGSAWREAKRRVTAPAPTLLRSPAVAKTCVHLEPRYISNGEASSMGEQLRETAAKLNTRCSGCNGKTTLQRCTGGGGVNGLTTLAWCSAKCVDKFTLKEAT